MRFLSNLFSLRRPASEPDAPLQYAAVAPDQLRQAVGHMLSYPHHATDARQVARFLHSAQARGMDLLQTRVATRAGRDAQDAREARVVYAICPVPLPGKILMLLSGTPADQSQREAADVLLHQIVSDYSASAYALMQVLVDPEDTAQIALYRTAGFTPLAELVYLECHARKLHHKLPEGGWQLLTYTPERHPLFAQAILASYEQTLDCPELNNLRSIDDVIVGHKAAGEFDPQNWFVLLYENHPAGVLILSRVPASDALELTYIGLARFARGRGIASELMKLAISRAAELSCRRLTTAVDSRNTPAMTMYVRAGMQRAGVRLALLRVIHNQGANSSTISPQEPK